MSRKLIVALVTVAMTVGSSSALAAKGGNGKPSATLVAGCTVDGNVVTGSGLPTDQVLNFMVTDAAGTSGWVLGSTDAGTWSVTVPPRTGPTTYEFASKTWGPNGTKYTVFANCSAS